MPRNIKATNAEPESATNYSKMTAVELKKLMDSRKIEGRSKLTKKETMIKVLELFDQNPEDKESIASLVAELSTPKKKNVSKSEMEEGNEQKEISSEEKSEEKPKKSRSTKSKPSSAESSTEEKASEEEKSKRKPRSKKISEEKTKTTSESSTEENVEEKPKRKPRTKKAVDASEEEAPSSEEKSSKKVSKKERDEELIKAGINRADYPRGTRFVKSSTGFKIVYPKGTVAPKETNIVEDSEEQPQSSEEKDKGSRDSKASSKASSKKSTPKKSQQKEEQKEEEPEKAYDSDATEGMPEEEVASIASASNVKTRDEIKESKQETRPDLEDDPSIQEVLSLTRDLLKRMKYLAREANENQDFKKSWLKTLSKLKDDFDQQLESLGASIDE
jgi:hypothetical protein